MAEKIRPLHLPPTSTPSQQSLLVPTSSPDGSTQHGMSVPKPQPQQVPGHHPQPQSSGQPDIALHARPASSSGPGALFTSFFGGVIFFYQIIVNEIIYSAQFLDMIATQYKVYLCQDTFFATH